MDQPNYFVINPLHIKIFYKKDNKIDNKFYEKINKLKIIYRKLNSLKNNI
tara:strand:+ start:4945 stop:5094 length:150 start_codon:yes stop_codon:yes gene_type:complete